MKTNDIRVIKLMKEGFSFETLRNLNESQINVLYKRIVKEQGTVTVPKDTEPNKIADIAKTGTNVQIADGELGEDTEDDDPLNPYGSGETTQAPHQVGPSTNDGFGVDPGKTPGMYQDGMDEGELEEKAVSKKQQKFMGVVKAMQDGDLPIKGKAGKVAQEMKPSDVDDFASTKHKGLPTKVENTKKESYLRNVKMIEESLIKLVQKHITPVMTKKDLMNIVEAGPGTKEAPVKTPTRTKPDKPSWTKPKHVPAPKAKKDDETFTMQLPSFLQFDNLNIEFNDEKKS